MQYYIGFCRNKGMFATGATNIEVFFKDGTAITNNVADAQYGQLRAIYFDVRAIPEPAT